MILIYFLPGKTAQMRVHTILSLFAPIKWITTPKMPPTINMAIAITIQMNLIRSFLIKRPSPPNGSQDLEWIRSLHRSRYC